VSEPTPAKKRPRAGLIGPLFGWELIRLARRGQDMRGRFILAATLLFVLTSFTQLWFWNVSPADVFLGTSQSMSIEQSAKFGRGFALTFVLAQLGIMMLLTPAYAAGGISEEKEKKTLVYLLVSDLTSREILMGKFAGRLVFLLGIMFAGLPILSMTTLYGGVSINFLLMSYLLTAGTVTMLAAISAAAAMVADTYRGALFRAYGLTALFVFAGCGAGPYFGPFGAVVYLFAGEASPAMFFGIGLGYPLAELFVAMLAVLLGLRWTRRLRSQPQTRDRDRDRNRRRDRERRRGRPDRPTDADFEVIDAPLEILEPTAAALPIARRLSAPVVPEPSADPVTESATARPAVAPRLRQRLRPPPVRTPLLYDAKQRPRIGDGDPFAWKEKYTTGNKFTSDDESIRGVLVAVGIAGGLVVGFFGFIVAIALLVSRFGEDARTFATGFFLIAGSGGFFLYLIVIGLAATGSVVKERQRNTLESLLTIPVDRRKILWPKYRIALRRALGWGIPAGLFLPVGFLFSRVPTVAPPVLVFVVASVPMIVGYGMLLSVRCRAATKAALWLLPAVALVTLFPLALWVNLQEYDWAFWTALACVPAALVAPLGWFFWSRAVAEFERDGRN
jgi:ABC-type transport system involved in multi-copper enzyme maturation permease subunit